MDRPIGYDFVTCAERSGVNWQLGSLANYTQIILPKFGTSASVNVRRVTMKSSISRVRLPVDNIRDNHVRCSYLVQKKMKTKGCLVKYANLSCTFVKKATSYRLQFNIGIIHFNIINISNERYSMLNQID